MIAGVNTPGVPIASFATRVADRVRDTGVKAQVATARGIKALRRQVAESPAQLCWPGLVPPRCGRQQSDDGTTPG
ncbi:hypothetical protein ACXR2U_14925 [Jatrophihabitans sp. YIM 134969]